MSSRIRILPKIALICLKVKQNLEIKIVSISKDVIYIHNFVCAKWSSQIPVSIRENLSGWIDPDQRAHLTYTVLYVTQTMEELIWSGPGG